MNRETVRELTKLYDDLSTLDDLLTSMLCNLERDQPMQRVGFYNHTNTFSGPQDYQPKHTGKAIAECVVTDMKIERGLIVTRIHSLGFETPESPLQPRQGTEP